MGFGYFYCKREVLADGIRTKPLNMVLTPWKDMNVHYFDVFSPLGLMSWCNIYADNIRFRSACHLFNFLKAEHNGALDMKEKIRNAKTPVDAAKLGMTIKTSAVWYDTRNRVMTEISVMKMQQTRAVKNYLIENKNKNFIYTDSFDSFWGCGQGRRIAEVIDPAKYPGRNKLGEIWTDIASSPDYI